MIERTVTTAALFLFASVLSPAYAGNASAAPMEQAVSDIERLIDGGQAPALSEDGARVAFVDGHYQIWVVNRDGSGRKRLTTAHFDMYPSWAPDGSRIAFRRSTISEGSSHNDVWIMNADGTGQVRLTDARSTGSYDRPVWSPDGTMLAMEAAVNGMMSEIYVMKIANKRFVNATRMNTGQNNRFDHQAPLWLADGERITALRNEDVVIINLEPVLARLNHNPSGRRPPAFVTAVSIP